MNYHQVTPNRFLQKVAADQSDSAATYTVKRSSRHGRDNHLIECASNTIGTRVNTNIKNDSQAIFSPGATHSSLNAKQSARKNEHGESSRYYFGRSRDVNAGTCTKSKGNQNASALKSKVLLKTKMAADRYSQASSNYSR